jgi:hypothetical protein
LGISARDLIAEDVWVTAALGSVDKDQRIVVTDVRFENEANTIKLMGGQIWRVKRPGVEAVNSHVSETQLDGYKVDQIFLNSGSIQDLELLIRTRMQNAFPE